MSTDKINAAAKLIVEATRSGAKRIAMPMSDSRPLIWILRPEEVSPPVSRACSSALSAVGLAAMSLPGVWYSDGTEMP